MKCKKCDSSVKTDSDLCPNCGEKLPKGTYMTQWIMLAIVIYVLMELLIGRSVGVVSKPETATQITK